MMIVDAVAAAVGTAAVDTVAVAVDTVVAVADTAAAIVDSKQAEGERRNGCKTLRHHWRAVRKRCKNVSYAY